MSLQHPCHSHSLTKGIPRLFCDTEHWECQVCQQRYDSSHFSHYCSVCSFDVCEECLSVRQHSRHEHSLYLAENTLFQLDHVDNWFCDACCESSDARYGYFCTEDLFKMCKECFRGRDFPIHIHNLLPTDAAAVYSSHGCPEEMWRCDFCGKSGGELGSRYSWHCSECQFDACDDCLKPMNNNLIHEHPLFRTDPRRVYAEKYGGHWRCDVCNRDSMYMEKPLQSMYHCQTCRPEFDACSVCLKFGPSGPPTTRPLPFPPGALPVPCPPPAPVILLPPPEEDIEENVEDIPTNELCVVCLKKRIRMCILHGNTGHSCCCSSCASVLLSTDAKCPICRQNIEGVIANLVL